MNSVLLLCPISPLPCIGWFDSDLLKPSRCHFPDFPSPISYELFADFHRKAMGHAVQAASNAKADR